MKFCYFDESGMGNEPYLVVAGIIVDATRMHVTKDAWADFLEYLSKAAGRQIDEFHSCAAIPAESFSEGGRGGRGSEGSKNQGIKA